MLKTDTIDYSQKLPLMESFLTLQGEGNYTGQAAYFIRLGGCDVGCVWCDVKDSWDANKHPQLTIEEIVSKSIDEVNAQLLSNTKTNSKETNTSKKLLSTQPILAVITGGEPLLHNLDVLTKALQAVGFATHIETSGSSPFSGNWDWICLSPKKFKAPLQEVTIKANELKVVVFNASDFLWAEQYAAQVQPSCKLYLQPEWDKAATVTPLIVNYILANPKWQLSLQIHKYINVP